jgi:hypothetical protein
MSFIRHRQNPLESACKHNLLHICDITFVLGFLKSKGMNMGKNRRNYLALISIEVEMLELIYLTTLLRKIKNVREFHSNVQH